MTTHKSLLLNDRDETIVEIDRLESISKRPTSTGAVVELYFYNRPNAVTIRYEAKTMIAFDYKRLIKAKGIEQSINPKEETDEEQ